MPRLTAVLILALTASAARGDVIALDDFDAPVNLGSRTVNPDLSGNDGFFPTDDRFDIFGIVNRAAAEARNSFDILDDSAGSFAADQFGILKTNQSDNVFAIEDLLNDDNTGGTGSVEWTFDISGFENLQLSIDFAAMGDFENSDTFVYAYSIDGSAFTDIFTSSVDEAGSQTYTLESGTMVTLNDPMLINGTLINNDLQTLTEGITGVGSSLTLRLEAEQNAGNEVFVFDNVLLEGDPTMAQVPEPAMLGFLGIMAAVGGAAWRRRRLAAG